MTVFLVGFTLVLALILTMGITTFVLACVRQKELPWLNDRALQKTAYGRFSDHIRKADRWLQEHNAQSVSTKSRDGLRLRGLWVPVENAKGTVLFVHGYRSCVLADFGLAYDFYRDMGFNLLLPDQRSHGKSEGKFITFGVRESEDMACWVNFHNREFGEFPMLLSGLSMGATTVMYMADMTLPDNVKGIIADCGFTTPGEIISLVFRKTVHLPAGIAVWLADRIARLVAGFSFYEKDTRRSLARSNLPIRMIHGTEDHFVPATMTRESYDACQTDKQLLLVEKAGHGVSFLQDKKHYAAMIIDFLNTIIP